METGEKFYSLSAQEMQMILERTNNLKEMWEQNVIANKKERKK